MLIYARKLLAPCGWRANQVVRVENGRIVSVTPGMSGDLAADRLVPGLFDDHCHGGEGYDPFTLDRARLEKYLMKLAQCGVTDILPSVYTHDVAEDYAKALDFLRQAMDAQARGLLGGARIQGIHMEGPFLSPERPGAMNPDAMPAPSPEAFEEMFGTYADIIRLVTLAPERPGADRLTAYLLNRGIPVQAGHTDATFEQANAAFDMGVSSLCHTFNAARPIHHRNPGVVTAALLDRRVFCEVICDFRHLHPGTVEMIYRMKGAERFCAISDSVLVTGLPDGEHEFDGKKYLVVDGTQRVHGGNTLSGGACYLDGCVRNLLSLGIPDEDAFRMASYTPALRLSMQRDAGSVVPGAMDHLAAFDGEGRVQFSVVDGAVYMAK